MRIIDSIREYWRKDRERWHERQDAIDEYYLGHITTFVESVLLVTPENTVADRRGKVLRVILTFPKDSVELSSPGVWAMRLLVERLRVLRDVRLYFLSPTQLIAIFPTRYR